MASSARLGPSVGVVLVLAATAFACGGAVETPTDDPSVPAVASSPPIGTVEHTPTSPADAGARCRDGERRAPAGSSSGCYGASGHVCGDYSPPHVCVDGAFQCPSGSIPVSECWCFGMNPPKGQCTCTPAGWSCTEDAGAGD